jgi:hypothetical protein
MPAAVTRPMHKKSNIIVKNYHAPNKHELILENPCLHKTGTLPCDGGWFIK